MLARDSVFNETLRIIVWSPHKLLTLGREMTSKITEQKRETRLETCLILVSLLQFLLPIFFQS